MARVSVAIVGAAASVLLALRARPSHATSATCANISGTWKDPRAATTWTIEEDTKTLRFTAHGPWPGAPSGQLFTNGSLWLRYSPTNLATGVLGSGCDTVVWTDAPDKRAGNTWCKLGSSRCARPSPPAPGPRPPAH